MAATGFADKVDIFSVVAVCFTAISLGFFAVGYAVQDWAAEPGVETGGKTDATWGTWVTSDVLFLQCAAIAAAAPGQGLSKYSIMVAFALDAVSWLCGGLLHQFFSAGGPGYEILWFGSLLTSVMGGFAKAYAAHVTVKEHGKCQCCPTSKIVGVAVGAVAALSGLGLVLAIYRQFPVQTWILVMVKKVVCVGAVAAYGFVGGAPRWASAVIVSFAAVMALGMIKPDPFKYSHDFNDKALVHSAQMLFVVAVFGLFQEISDAAEVHSSNRFMQGLQEVKQHLQERARAIEEALPLKDDAQPCCTGCAR